MASIGQPLNIFVLLRSHFDLRSCSWPCVVWYILGDPRTVPWFTVHFVFMILVFWLQIFGVIFAVFDEISINRVLLSLISSDSTHTQAQTQWHGWHLLGASHLSYVQLLIAVIILYRHYNPFMARTIRSHDRRTRNSNWKWKFRAHCRRSWYFFWTHCRRGVSAIWNGNEMELEWK